MWKHRTTVLILWLALTGEARGLVARPQPLATGAAAMQRWCDAQVGKSVLNNVVADSAVWMHSCFMLLERDWPNEKLRLVQVWTQRCEEWPDVPAGYYAHMAYVYGKWLNDAVTAAFTHRLSLLQADEGVVVGLKRHAGTWYNAGYSDTPGYYNQWLWPMEEHVRPLWADGHPPAAGYQLHAVLNYRTGNLTAVVPATSGMGLCQIQHATHERADTSGNRPSHFRRDTGLRAKPTPEATYKVIVGERSPLLCANSCARADRAQCTAAAYSPSLAMCLLAWDMHNSSRYVPDDSYDVYWKLTIE